MVSTNAFCRLFTTSFSTVPVWLVRWGTLSWARWVEERVQLHLDDPFGKPSWELSDGRARDQLHQPTMSRWRETTAAVSTRATSSPTLRRTAEGQAVFDRRRWRDVRCSGETFFLHYILFNFYDNLLFIIFSPLFSAKRIRSSYAYLFHECLTRFCWHVPVARHW